MGKLEDLSDFKFNMRVLSLTMALVMGANAASIQGGYHDDKGNHISKAEWERQNMSKKMPGFDSYSAAYMGFNDYNPDYQY